MEELCSHKTASCIVYMGFFYQCNNKLLLDSETTKLSVDLCNKKSQLEFGFDLFIVDLNHDMMDMFNSEIQNGRNITLNLGKSVSLVKAQLKYNFGKRQKKHNTLH